MIATQSNWPEVAQPSARYEMSPTPAEKTEEAAEQSKPRYKLIQTIIQYN